MWAGEPSRDVIWEIPAEDPQLLDALLAGYESHQGGTDLSSSLNTARIEPDRAETVSAHKTYKERRSLALRKRREGKPLTDDEQRIIGTHDKYNAKRNAKRSEIRRKRKSRAGKP